MSGGAARSTGLALPDRAALASPFRFAKLGALFPVECFRSFSSRFGHVGAALILRQVRVVLASRAVAAFAFEFTFGRRLLGHGHKRLQTACQAGRETAGGRSFLGVV